MKINRNAKKFSNGETGTPTNTFIDLDSSNPRYNAMFLFQKMDFHNYSREEGWTPANNQNTE